MAKVDASCKIDHQELYRERMIAWPPSKEDLRRVCGDESIVAYGDRRMEALYYCSTVFKMPDDQQFQFLDINSSLTRLTGISGLDQPWKSGVMGTMVGSSSMVIRQRTQCKAIKVRPLSGLEMMSFAGWHPTFYIDGAPSATDEVLGQMSGNCFNAFSFAALRTAVIAVCGLSDDDFSLGLETESD